MPLDLLPYRLLKVKCWRLAHLVLLPGELPFPVPLCQAHHIFSQTSFTLSAFPSSLRRSCAKDCLRGQGPACPPCCLSMPCVCSFQTCSSHRGVPTLYLVQHRVTFPFQSTLASLSLFVLCFSSTRGAVCIPVTRAIRTGSMELKWYCRMVRETPGSSSDLLWSMWHASPVNDRPLIGLLITHSFRMNHYGYY